MPPRSGGMRSHTKFCPRTGVLRFFLTCKMKPSILISYDWECVGYDLSRDVAINVGFYICLESDGSYVESRSYNMAHNPDAADAATLEWWKSTETNRLAWARCTENPRHPREVMADIAQWFDELAKSFSFGAFVCYPTIYDGSLLATYWFRYLGKTGPFSRGPPATYDIRSYASGVLGLPYKDCNKMAALAKYCPSSEDCPHTHTGIDDAKEQMVLFLNIQKARYAGLLDK